MPATLTSTAQAADQTLAVTLCQIIEQTAPYAVEVEGSQLAPRYRHGQNITLYPAPAADPAAIAPGSLVLAALEHPHRPNQYHHFDLLPLGTQGELQSGVDCGDCRVEPGAFVVLGVELECVLPAIVSTSTTKKLFLPSLEISSCHQRT